MDWWTNLFSTLYIKDLLKNSALSKEFHYLEDFIKQISFVNTAIFCCTVWMKERYAYRYTKLNFFAPKKYCELTVFFGDTLCKCKYFVKGWRNECRNIV